LKTFGAVANILDTNECEFEFDAMKVKSTYLFRLILALEQLEASLDNLELLSLVKADKPLKALDLCYRDDPNTFSLLTDALSSCVTVCAYDPESRRSYQMLVGDFIKF